MNSVITPIGRSSMRKTAVYKQAGNSIVVNVLEGILRNLLLPADPHKQEAQDILKWLDEVMEVRD